QEPLSKSTAQVAYLAQHYLQDAADLAEISRVCEHNSRVAESIGLELTAHVWKTLATLFEEDNSDGEGMASAAPATVSASGTVSALPPPAATVDGSAEAVAPGIAGIAAAGAGGGSSLLPRQSLDFSTTKTLRGEEEEILHRLRQLRIPLSAVL